MVLAFPITNGIAKEQCTPVMTPTGRARKPQSHKLITVAACDLVLSHLLGFFLSVGFCRGSRVICRLSRVECRGFKNNGDLFIIIYLLSVYVFSLLLF